jgi:NAD(P)H-dependent flavin oxidoreductase YrpB (nitropropane dioxygenase family)
VLRTRVCDVLGITHPILQAGMASYTSPALVAAVSNVGGLGVHGTVGRDAAAVRTVVRATRELTGGRPFGVNHVVQWLDRDAFEVCLDERVPVFSFSFGAPEDFARRARDAGARIICQVTRVDQVEACLASGADILIAQGTEAGGHSGFVPLATLLPAVVAASGDVPVLAAGGLVDGAGLADALARGAAGAWIGTRFLATPEAWASPSWKQAIVAAQPGDTVHTLAFDVLWGRLWRGAKLRVIRNAFTEAWDGRESALHERVDEVEQLVWQAERADDPRLIALMAGAGAGAIRETRPAADLVVEIAADAERILAHAAAHGAA